jgi:acyl-CoA synthetase (NDP forming)/RimJ/RimL family protein N-acetyltransferase
VPVDVALRDGSTVRIRPVAPEDRDALRALLGNLSEDSRWMRFLSAGVNLDGAAQRAADNANGLVVTAGDPPEIVAHAEYVPERDDRAEVAFEVADAWNGRGIATILLAHLAEDAERDGIRTFVAYVHPRNHKMVGVFRGAGFPVEVSAQAGELMVVLPAALGDDARTAFEDRARAAAVAAVRHVLAPASVVVHGSAVLAPGYLGERRESGAAELALVAGDPEAVLETARECARAGVQALAVQSGGFADAGDTGRARLAALLAICRSGGMRLVGPNCLGVINTDPAVRLAATTAGGDPGPGAIALASQSSAIGLAAIAEARRRGLGLSTFVSTGDKADLSGNDFLQYWQQDPATKVVLLYLESFGNPRRFGQVARRVAATKPIVAVKTGRSAGAERGHETDTGRLLGASDVTVDALFAHAGVIRTETVTEQLDVAALLQSQPLPRGGRVAIVTNARGPALACADALADGGLQPLEPVDLRAGATAADYAGALAAVEADAAIAIFVPLGPTAPQEVVPVLRSDRPVLAVCMAQDEDTLRELAADGPPVYAAPVVAARTLGKVVRYARWRETAATEPEPLEADGDAAAAVLARALAGGEEWLGPEQVEELLGAYGVPLVESRLAATPEEAETAARELGGGPVAVKALVPGLAHKSDIGAVILGAEDARGAAARAAEAVRAAGHEPAGFAVQRMAPPGVELLAGVLGDPDFGPVVACGAAGPALELTGDVTVRLAPLARADAAAMVRELRTFPLLDGYRGAPPVDVAALEDILVRISRLAAAHAEVLELDCGPVLVSPAGALVLDARVRVRSPRAARPFPALDR